MKELVLGVAVALPILATGCHSITTRYATKKETKEEEVSKTDGMVLKTDFHSKADAGQKYNVHLELGRAFESQGNFEAAVTEYQKSVDACARQGRFAGKGRVPKADEAESHRRLAGALDRLGRFAQAEAHYRTALHLSPGNPKVWNDSGYSYYMQGRLVDAERNLKTAAKIDPANPRVQTNLGLALAAAGKDDEALAAFSRAGGPAAGHANLAYVQASLGKTDVARRHYQTALELQPQLAPVREALARLDSPRARSTPATAVAARPPARADANVRLTTSPVGTPGPAMR